MMLVHDSQNISMVGGRGFFISSYWSMSVALRGLVLIYLHLNIHVMYFNHIVHVVLMLFLSCREKKLKSHFFAL